MDKTKVAFICVHNSCRSQIAEALANKFASDVIEAYSAGTILKKNINPDAVRIMKDVYGIDMEKSQYPKLLSDIPTVDIGVTMGCDVACPRILANHIEDWGLDDPTGKADEDFIIIIKEIEKKVKDIRERIINSDIKN